MLSWLSAMELLIVSDVYKSDLVGLAGTSKEFGESIGENIGRT